MPKKRGTIIEFLRLFGLKKPSHQEVKKDVTMYKPSQTSGNKQPDVKVAENITSPNPQYQEVKIIQNNDVKYPKANALFKYKFNQLKHESKNNTKASSQSTIQYTSEVKFTEKIVGILSPIHFAKSHGMPFFITKNSLSMYSNNSTVPSNAVYLQEVRNKNISIFAKPNAIYPSSDHKYSTFPQYPNEKKPEMALILTPYHISVLYKSKDGKLFFIDNGGITINDSDKPFIKDLINNQGFNYIRTNVLASKDLKKMDLNDDANMKFISKLSLCQPITNDEIEMFNSGIEYQIEQKKIQGKQAVCCTQTAMAICLMFQKAQSEGKELDLTKIISNFNTLKNLENLKESNSLVEIVRKQKPNVRGVFDETNNRPNSHASSKFFR